MWQFSHFYQSFLSNTEGCNSKNECLNNTKVRVIPFAFLVSNSISKLTTIFLSEINFDTNKAMHSYIPLSKQPVIIFEFKNINAKCNTTYRS